MKVYNKISNTLQTQFSWCFSGVWERKGERKREREEKSLWAKYHVNKPIVYAVKIRIELHGKLDTCCQSFLHIFFNGKLFTIQLFVCKQCHLVVVKLYFFLRVWTPLSFSLILFFFLLNIDLLLLNNIWPIFFTNVYCIVFLFYVANILYIASLHPVAYRRMGSNLLFLCQQLVKRSNPGIQI